MHKYSSDDFRALPNLLRSHASHRAGRQLGRVERECCAWQFHVERPRLHLLRLDRQRPSNNAQPGLHKSLTSGPSAGPKQWDLLSRLEIARASSSYHDWRGRSFCQHDLGPICQCAHDFQMNHKMLLELLPPTVVGRRTIENQISNSSWKAPSRGLSTHIRNCRRRHPMGYTAYSPSASEPSS